MASHTTVVTYLYEALAEPYGLKLHCPDPIRFKSMLYSARAKQKDPTLSRVQIRTSPANPAGELWLICPPEDDES